MSEPEVPTPIAQVHARAALVGNPSDGYGGAVLAVPIPHFAAKATIDTHRSDRSHTNGGGVDALVRATRQRFVTEHPTAVNGPEIKVSTNIPRSVGLAGSSAIVIATIRALAQTNEVPMNERAVEQLAHTVERIDLGIAGGWQDQIVQSDRSGQPLLMDFADPSMPRTPIDAPPIPLFVAYAEDAAESSTVPHSDLRSRAEDVTAVMHKLADVARTAARALAAHDTHGLKQAIDNTFELRTTIMPLRADHVALIDTARAAGASCNFAGSGGAIVGVVPKDADSFIAAIQSAGLSIVTWNL